MIPRWPAESPFEHFTPDGHYRKAVSIPDLDPGLYVVGDVVVGPFSGYEAIDRYLKATEALGPREGIWQVKRSSAGLTSVEFHYGP